MKIELKVEAKELGNAADSLRACAATLRHHGIGPYATPLVALAVAEALEREAERLSPAAKNDDERWGWL